jgi:hypothetical protein
MQIESYQLFAQLLEGYVNEASTSMNLIANNPGGKEVVQSLHKNQALGHDIEYSPVAKISWSDLKDSYKGAWVIIIGASGTGAIRAKGGTTGSYEAVASTGGETRSVSDGRGGNIIDFLKSEIGALRKFYVGKNTSAVADKKKKRAGQKPADGPAVTKDSLVKKFKPLWARAMVAAIADVKGHVSNMIKNDAFEKAKKKLNHIETLQNSLEQLEAGSLEDSPPIVQKAVNSAILMTASHYYPDTTGEISRSRYGGNDLSAQNSEGPSQLLKDIANGDQKKLGTLLSFFKRSLVSG